MRNNKRPGSDPLNLLPESFLRCSKNWVLVHWQSNWSDCPPPPPNTSLWIIFGLEDKNAHLTPQIPSPCDGILGAAFGPKRSRADPWWGVQGGQSPSTENKFASFSFPVIPDQKFCNFTSYINEDFSMHVILHIGIRARSHEFCSIKY